MSERERLTEIFHLAARLPPEKRVELLDRACAGDPALRAEVEALLAADDRASDGAATDVLRRRVARAAAEVSAASTFPLPERIGPYRVVELLGEGGMGVVYRAEQTEPVHRDVALKLVRAGFQSADAVVRFEAERQTLALMDHPNVAHLYDAGTTDDRRPYFVMELVRGVAITEYCRTEHLSSRARVELFLDVCKGVRHAHRRGVIHRDLKPSNILVTREEGHALPKVIDFSVAKALGEPAGSDLLTRTGQVIGTLAYMSPEQAAGRAGAIDVRSDVYALGVVLYELLVDRLPHAVDGLPIHEAVRRIVEDPPAPLDDIGDDLDTIIGKCLEKDPERRYGSAAELVEDLERSLGSRPILARPPSTLYQMRKLVGRHRAVFASAGLALVLLIAFSVTVTVQLGIQRRERARAESEAHKARRINTFLQEMLAAADPAKLGGKASIREVLDQASKRADSLADEPAVAAELERTLADSYSALGLRKEQKEHREKELATALRVYGEDHPETGRARLDMSQMLRGESRYTEAEEQAQRALEIFRRHHEGDDLDVASALTGLSEIAFQAGRLEDSRKAAEEALGIRRRLLDDSDPLLADSLHQLGGTLTELRRVAEGEKLERQAADIYKAKFGERSVSYLDVLSDLSINLGYQGRIEECLALDRQVLEGRLAILGPDHPMTAVIHNNLAALLGSLGRCAEAEGHMVAALRVWRAKLGDDHRDVATGWNNVGYARQCAGDYRGAREAYETAWRITRKRPEEMSSVLPALCHNLASIDDRTGNRKEAERFVRQLLGGSAECGGQRPPEPWGDLHELGSLLIDEGRLPDAETALREAREAIEDKARKDGKKAEEIDYYAILLNALGRLRMAQGATAEGEEFLGRARAGLFRSTESADDRRLELTHTIEMYGRLRDPSDAAPYRAALERLDRATKSKGSAS